MTENNHKKSQEKITGVDRNRIHSWTTGIYRLRT